MLLSCASEFATSKVSKSYGKSKSTSLSCDILMDSDSNALTITLVGPSTVWYGVGFGNDAMSKTYAIIADGQGNVEERYLIGTSAGNKLDNTFTIISNKVSGSLRTITLSRDLNYKLPTTYHYKFSLDDSHLKTIYGSGTTSYLSYHGDDKRGSATLTMARSTNEQQTESVIKNPTTKKSFMHSVSIQLKKHMISLLGSIVFFIIVIGIILYFVFKNKNQTKINYTRLPSKTTRQNVGNNTKCNKANGENEENSENEYLVIA